MERAVNLGGPKAGGHGSLVVSSYGTLPMAAMLVVGRLSSRLNTRILRGIGLVAPAWSFYTMTGWTPDVCPGA